MSFGHATANAKTKNGAVDDLLCLILLSFRFQVLQRSDDIAVLYSSVNTKWRFEELGRFHVLRNAYITCTKLNEFLFNLQTMANSLHKYHNSWDKRETTWSWCFHLRHASRVVQADRIWSIAIEYSNLIDRHANTSDRARGTEYFRKFSMEETTVQLGSTDSNRKVSIFCAFFRIFKPLRMSLNLV